MALELQQDAADREIKDLSCYQNHKSSVDIVQFLFIVSAMLSGLFLFSTLRLCNISVFLSGIFVVVVIVLFVFSLGSVCSKRTSMQYVCLSFRSCFCFCFQPYVCMCVKETSLQYNYLSFFQVLFCF